MIGWNQPFPGWLPVFFGDKLWPPKVAAPSAEAAALSWLLNYLYLGKGQSSSDVFVVLEVDGIWSDLLSLSYSEYSFYIPIHRVFCLILQGASLTKLLHPLFWRKFKSTTCVRPWRTRRCELQFEQVGKRWRNFWSPRFSFPLFNTPDN